MAVVRYREALNQALREEMERDENVYLMGEDIGVFNGAFKVTNGLLAELGQIAFGSQHRNLNVKVSGRHDIGGPDQAPDRRHQPVGKIQTEPRRG